MRVQRWLAAAIVALVGVSAPVVAQEGPQPGVVSVRYFECGLGELGDAVRLVNEEWRPIAQQLIDEGMLLDYGILTHSWGDEWNLLDYYVAETTQAFHTAWAELVRRVQAQDPDGNMFEEFAEYCPRHKDNIYSVVAPAP
jgi:hypothetical protein